MGGPGRSIQGNRIGSSVRLRGMEWQPMQGKISLDGFAAGIAVIVFVATVTSVTFSALGILSI